MREAAELRKSLRKSSIEKEIVLLRDLDLKGLRVRWRNAFGRAAPEHLTRYLLFRIIAYRLQADRLGDLDAQALKVLDQAAAGQDEQRFTASKKLPHARNGRKNGLLPSEPGQKAVFLTRSPEIAAYWANMMGSKIDDFSGGILVLDRSSLTRIYRLEPTRYTENWSDEREESIWERPINFRRHLLGVVRHVDVDALLGPRENPHASRRFYFWPKRSKYSFWHNKFRSSESFTRDGRAKVRKLINQEQANLIMIRATLTERSRPSVSTRVKSQQSTRSSDCNE